MNRLLLLLVICAAAFATAPQAAAQDLPFGWYEAFGLNPFDPNVDLQDPDCDGLNNRGEFFAGSDPLDCNSPEPCPNLCTDPEPPANFRIEVSTDPVLKLELTWDAEPGQSYVVEFRDASGWQPLETTDEGQFEFEPNLFTHPTAILRVRVEE